MKAKQKVSELPTVKAIFCISFVIASVLMRPDLTLYLH